MRGARPVLSALLSLVLLVQTGWAAAHCLIVVARAGHAVEICSPDGVRTIRVAEDGSALPETPAQAGDGFCAACPAITVPTLPAAPGLSAPAWIAIAAALVPAAILRPAARAPPYAPRAPPTFA